MPAALLRLDLYQRCQARQQLLQLLATAEQADEQLLIIDAVHAATGGLPYADISVPCLQLVLAGHQLTEHQLLGLLAAAVEHLVPFEQFVQLYVLHPARPGGRVLAADLTPLPLAA